MWPGAAWSFVFEGAASGLGLKLLCLRELHVGLGLLGTLLMRVQVLWLWCKAT